MCHKKKDKCKSLGRHVTQQPSPRNGPCFLIRCPPDPVRLITHSQTKEFSESPVVHGWKKVSSPSSSPALLSTIPSLIKTYPPSMTDRPIVPPVISLYTSLKLWLGPHYAQTLPTAFMAQLPTQIFSWYLYTFPTLWSLPQYLYIFPNDGEILKQNIISLYSLFRASN